MSDVDQLLGRLRRLRRRLRTTAALEGAVLGGLCFLAAAESVAFTAGLTGASRVALALGHPSSLGVALSIGALLGAGLWSRSGHPRFRLEAVARRIDQRAGRQPGRTGEPDNGDRVRLALDLAGEHAPSRFAAAAVTEGLKAASALPLGAVVPWRRPAGMVPLMVLLVLAVPLHRWSRGRTAEDPRSPMRAAVRYPQPLPGQAHTLIEDARAQVDQLQQVARAMGDRQLRELAESIARTLDELVARGAGEPAAVATLADEARAATEEAQRAAVGRVAGRESAPTPPGASWPKDGPMGALGAGTAPEDDRERRRRRLAGLDDQGPSAEAGGATGAGRAEAEEQARRLERLARELDEPRPAMSGAAPPAGRGPAPGAGAAGPGGGPSASDSARERLARAEQRLRQGLEGGPPAQGRRDPEGAGASTAGESPVASSADPTTGLSDFERRARGGDPAAGVAGGEGSGEGRTRARAGAGEARGEGGQEQPRGSSPGERAGAGEDGTPGRAGAALEASVRDGPGPSRAQSIAVGAGAGFAQPGYDRTYRAYRAAVEETLDLTAVPEGRQQLVRRYFELIRPRTR